MSNFIPNHGMVRDRDVKILVEFLQSARKLLVITGAGISTESGIPDYRSEGVGLYARSNHKPMQHMEFMNNPESRKRYWARNFIAWPYFHSKMPNFTHKFLKKYEVNNTLSAVITQNVDGLHHKAGNEALVELHGTSYRVICIKCKTVYDRVTLQDHIQSMNPQLAQQRDLLLRPDGDVHLEQHIVDEFVPPHCVNCKAPIKPDIVFFGGNVPAHRVNLVQIFLEHSDAVLVLGSSMSTFSAYRIAMQAAELKKPICVINIGPSRVDELASIRVGNTKCGDILTKVAAEMNITIF